jgi:hypothetical protein
MAIKLMGGKPAAAIHKAARVGHSKSRLPTGRFSLISLR